MIQIVFIVLFSWEHGWQGQVSRKDLELVYFLSCDWSDDINPNISLVYMVSKTISLHSYRQMSVIVTTFTRYGDAENCCFHLRTVNLLSFHLFSQYLAVCIVKLNGATNSEKNNEVKFKVEMFLLISKKVKIFILAFMQWFQIINLK